MKKQFLLVIACLYSLTVVSQVNFGVKAGTTLSKYRSSTEEGIIPEYNTIAGFYGGAFAETVINNYFSLQPELLFSMRGAQSTIIQTVTIPVTTGYITVPVKMKATFVPLYIDLPVYLKVGFPSAGSDKLTLGVGPLFSYGICGKAKFKGSANNENFTAEMNLFSEDELVIKDNNGNTNPSGESSTLQKRFDAGIAGFVSYEFNNLIILCLNYQYGLKNISDDPDEDLWNRCLSISVGYKF
jgi:hypothetical protein